MKWNRISISEVQYSVFVIYCMKKKIVLPIVLLNIKFIKLVNMWHGVNREYGQSEMKQGFWTVIWLMSFMAFYVITWHWMTSDDIRCHLMTSDDIRCQLMTSDVIELFKNCWVSLSVCLSVSDKRKRIDADFHLWEK